MNGGEPDCIAFSVDGKLLTWARATQFTCATQAQGPPQEAFSSVIDLGYVPSRSARTALESRLLQWTDRYGCGTCALVR